MRIILFTGKGGSGVSSLAAATAAAAARQGRRTLAFGVQRGLGAAFGLPLTGEAAAVADNLRAVDGQRPFHEAEPFRDWLRELLDWRSMDPALADDMASLPGLGYVARLLEIESHLEEADYDVMVVDGPPLEACLDLLGALDAAARWLNRLFPVRQPTVFEPFLRALTAYSPSGDDVYEHGRALLLRLARLRELLTDPEVASVRVVLTCDRPALAQAQQGVAALSLFAYPTDAAAVNRLLPPQAAGPFFEKARADQQDLLPYIQESLAPMPTLISPLLSGAPAGAEALGDLAQDLYHRHDPIGVLYHGPVHAFSQRDGHHLLSLALPFARREEITLEQVGDSLTVQLARHRRTIPLPQEVRYLDAISSSFDEQTLRITFGRSKAGEK